MTRKLDIGTLISGQPYLLKPCRADKSYTLKVTDERLSGNDIVRALLASSKCNLVAQTKVLSILELEGTLISVHFRGEMLLRQVPSREHADAVAAKIVTMINSANYR